MGARGVTEEQTVRVLAAHMQMRVSSLASAAYTWLDISSPFSIHRPPNIQIEIWWYEEPRSP